MPSRPPFAKPGLLYQKLVAEGVLRERGALPPVLPVVIYNSRSPWTAPADDVRADRGGRSGAAGHVIGLLRLRDDEKLTDAFSAWAEKENP